MGTPKILIFGESGGASRLNADEVSSQCDLATERVITGLLRVRKLPSLCDYYVIHILCLSHLSGNGVLTGKKSISKNDEINY